MRANSLKYCAGLIGASQATTYAGLMGARVVHALGSGVCEALPVQLVNDIFFLHERGTRLGVYTGETASAPGDYLRSSNANDSGSMPLLRLDWAPLRWIHAGRGLLVAPLLLRGVCLRGSSTDIGIFIRGGDDVPPENTA